MSRKVSGLVEQLAVAVLGLVVVGAGTQKGASPPKTLTPKKCLTFQERPSPPQNVIEVTFLGVGGFLVRWSGESVMTPPLYSNPTMGEVVLSDLYSDTERIDRFLHYDLQNLKAIIVGHAHYDHALEIPYIAWKKAPEAWIYGSRTLVNILEPMTCQPGAKNPLIEVESQALCRITDPFVDPCSKNSNPCANSHPIKIAKYFQVWPIVSEHSPPLGPNLIKYERHALGRILLFFFPVEPVTGWRGQLLAPATTLPTRVGGWTCGTTLSYVIELLDGTGQPVFRIYYQDSPTRKPIGYPPSCLGKIDLALLCVGGATDLPKVAGERFPGDIVKAITPRFVMGGHWENFFKPRELPLPGKTSVKEKIGPAPGVDPDQFTEDVQAALPAARVKVPCPEDVSYFIRDPENPQTWTLDPTSKGSWTKPNVRSRLPGGSPPNRTR